MTQDTTQSLVDLIYNVSKKKSKSPQTIWVGDRRSGCNCLYLVYAPSQRKSNFRDITRNVAGKTRYYADHGGIYGAAQGGEND